MMISKTESHLISQKVRCPAKLNLTFEIIGNRADGYHEVVTLLQSIDLIDELTFELDLKPTNMKVPGKIELILDESPSGASFPLDDSNLIARAARAFFEATSITDSFLSVRVEKRIPIAAGLAGGSSNAAATLRALNQISPRSLDEDSLFELARGLGADVPFALKGGCCVGRGKGDELQELRSDRKIFFLIAKLPWLSLETAAVFAKYDECMGEKASLLAPEKTLTERAAQALQTGDIDRLAVLVHNDLEEPVLAQNPDLLHMRDLMLQAGARCVRMTGSGPTLYAMDKSKKNLQLVKNELEARFASFTSFWKQLKTDAPQGLSPADKIELHLVSSLGTGVELI